MNQDIEQYVITSDQPASFGDALTYLDQCVNTLRNSHGAFPTNDEPPISIPYHLDDRNVLVASEKSGRVLVQVEEAGLRRAYMYDAYGSHHVIINEFADPTSDMPTSSAALNETTANAAIVIDICDYVSRAANHSQDS